MDNTQSVIDNALERLDPYRKDIFYEILSEYIFLYKKYNKESRSMKKLETRESLGICIDSLKEITEGIYLNGFKCNSSFVDYIVDLASKNVSASLA